MLTKVLRSNLIRSLGLLFFQVIILNEIHVHVPIIPYFYVLFIILMPFGISPALSLILAFALGLSVDMFSNTGAIHAAAAVLVAFVRPYTLKAMKPVMGYEDLVRPGMRKLGFSWFVMYSALLIILHHFALYFLEVFTFTEVLFTLSRIMGSSLITLFLVLIFEFLFQSKNN